MTTPIRIALVEDNADLRDELTFHLRRLGHEVAGFADSSQLDAWLRDNLPDVLVLDVGLPGESGLAIAARLRANHPALGIVMLTARGEVDDRVAGFDSGADIYLVKPADLRELSVVVESLYRRAHRLVRPARQDYWQLDGQTLELLAPGGEKVLLTSTEFKLMRVLAESAPEGVKRAQLVEALGYRDHDFDHRRLETAMSRLRKKLEHRAGEAPPLRSVRSVGYAFVATIRIWTP
jgi:DNA-binding response OmpR family regulator